MMNLEFAFRYEVRAEGPMDDTLGHAISKRQYWRIHGAKLDGPNIKAKQKYDGSDWMRVSDDGFWRPDVRIPFETDDGVTLLAHYTGLVELNDIFKEAAEKNRATDFGDHRVRLSLSFEVSDEKYLWLAQNLFVAKGRLLGTGHLEYEVFRVC